MQLVADMAMSVQSPFASFRVVLKRIADLDAKLQTQSEPLATLKSSPDAWPLRLDGMLLLS
jgi:hypothetical protein